VLVHGTSCSYCFISIQKDTSDKRAYNTGHKAIHPIVSLSREQPNAFTRRWPATHQRGPKDGGGRTLRTLWYAVQQILEWGVALSPKVAALTSGAACLRGTPQGAYERSLASPTAGSHMPALPKLDSFTVPDLGSTNRFSGCSASGVGGRDGGRKVMFRLLEVAKIFKMFGTGLGPFGEGKRSRCGGQREPPENTGNAIVCC